MPRLIKSPAWKSIFRLLYVLAMLAMLGQRSDAGTLAQFRTRYGDIDVELFDQEKPVTVANFLKYIRSGAFENTFLHRCVPGFVVQGGGFFTTNRNDSSDFINVFPVPTFSPITNEFFVGPRLSNTYGTIAMAQAGTDRNSATSQWFFNIANNGAGQPNDLDNLNGGFAVFGRMVRGTNFLNDYNNRFYGFGLVNLGNAYGGAFSFLPVSYVGNFYPYYNELLYVDITLLNVQVSRGTNGMREISWNSVNGRTNFVQFTTNFPPSWQTLVTTNGNGLTMRVTDDTAAAAGRFYRVRVDY